MSDTAIEKTIHLKSPIEKVWAFLTTPDKLARWFHETDQPLDKAGVDFIWLRHDTDAGDRKLMWGRVLEADAPNRLVHTFTHQWIDGMETTVTWELTAIGDGTRLKLTHEGLDQRENPIEELGSHDKGWDAHLYRLRDII
ncbi:SRPBCC domain-containing protein [Henriciella sp.]|uniref:SRPBCC family protein n=1 Tax=Henriciella sp. TaxID=1968823 RepID=UPI0026213E23|nr:SRPBCC domain-containing protein [Henriciella sp.]